MDDLLDEGSRFRSRAFILFRHIVLDRETPCHLGQGSASGDQQTDFGPERLHFFGVAAGLDRIGVFSRRAGAPIRAFERDSVTVVFKKEGGGVPPSLFPGGTRRGREDGAANLLCGAEGAGLREHVKDETVDLVYLDPPFNSNASYNVLFKEPDGHESHAQMEAFEDTWHWDAPAEKAFDEVMQSGNADAAEMLRAMRAFLHENDRMAYLAMMAVRLTVHLWL